MFRVVDLFPARFLCIISYGNCQNLYNYKGELCLVKFLEKYQLL